VRWGLNERHPFILVGGLQRLEENQEPLFLSATTLRTNVTGSSRSRPNGEEEEEEKTHRASCGPRRGNARAILLASGPEGGSATINQAKGQASSGGPPQKATAKHEQPLAPAPPSRKNQNLGWTIPLFLGIERCAAKMTLPCRSGMVRYTVQMALRHMRQDIFEKDGFATQISIGSRTGHVTRRGSRAAGGTNDAVRIERGPPAFAPPHCLF
jgi:hypothetical protein